MARHRSWSLPGSQSYSSHAMLDDYEGQDGSTSRNDYIVQDFEDLWVLPVPRTPSAGLDFGDLNFEWLEWFVDQVHLPKRAFVLMYRVYGSPMIASHLPSRLSPINQIRDVSLFSCYNAARN